MTSIFLFCGVIEINRDNLDSSDQAVSQEFVTFMLLFLGLPAALSRIAAGVAFLKAFIDCNSKFSSYPPRGPQDPNEASVMSNGLISSCFFFMLSQYDIILYIYWCYLHTILFTFSQYLFQLLYIILFYVIPIYIYSVLSQYDGALWCYLSYILCGPKINMFMLSRYDGSLLYINYYYTM